MFNQAGGPYSEQPRKEEQPPKERTVQKANYEEDIEQRSYPKPGKSSESLPPAPNATGICCRPRQAAFIG
jgi:hypothetical protein